MNDLIPFLHQLTFSTLNSDEVIIIYNNLVGEKSQTIDSKIIIIEWGGYYNSIEMIVYILII
jgi:hypothetical protein